MGRRKKPEGETVEQTKARHSLESISNAATRSERVSWDRKMDNMVKLLSKLRPIEDQITDLMAKKIPLFDEIAALRKEMVHECVHPYTHLILKSNEEGEEFIECKFCNHKFGLVDDGS